MARTDLIGDMLTVIRNGILSKKDSAVVVASKTNSAVLEILKAEGYIENFKEQETIGKTKTIKVYLKYDSEKNTAIKGLKRISRPGLRVYSGYTKMPKVLRGFGKAIVSTSSGVMTNSQAKEKKLGGEIICYVW